MALITNNISGSASDSWKVGITGSVVIANPGAANDVSGNGFNRPGLDVGFFVSGSRESKGGTNRTVAVFGGDTVVSGNLTIGTGSVTITSNEIQFLGGKARIYSSSQGLVLEDSSGPKVLSTLTAGGGSPGGSSNQFQFNNGGAFGGANALSYDSAQEIVKSGRLVVSSTANTAGGGALVSSGTMLFKTSTNDITVDIGANGVISGSSNLLAGGNLTVGGTSTLRGNVTAEGTLTVTSDFTANGNVTLGDASADVVTIKGNLNVLGTTTTISSSNTTIADPVLLIGSGSVGPNANSIIAFSSGSKNTANDVNFGAKDGILVAAQYNTTGGNLPYADIAAKALVNSNLIAIKASQFYVNSDVASITSDGNTLTVSGSGGGGVRLSNGNNQQVSLFSDTTNYFNFRYDSGPGSVLLDGQSKKIQVSGSQIILQTSGTAGNEGIQFAQNIGITSNPYLYITSGTVGANVTGQGNINFSAGASAGNVNVTAAAGFINLQVSSSQALNIQAGAGGNFLQISSGSVGGFNNAAKISTFTGKDIVLQTADLSTKVAFANSASTYAYAFTGSIGSGGTAITNAGVIQSEVNKALVISGTTALILGGGAGGGAAGYHAFVGQNTNLQAVVRQGLFPAADKAVQEFDLGADNRRWANIYTGDLHLRNERGDYTLIEESDFLSIRFNKTGKRYKFLLERVPELDG